ncbi:lasso RiPP family leader peptide-containing protein [Nocardia arthritidis]|uniref:Lasso RiPP family leader peptide-containing protein n=1 Tax=Nocardia arthritidis TaxID=228602 RepID=A0A6G9YLT0_9NOCA|nr:lasso RiPP family leader peptide-containing protein [Nocardia arthritidis]QIS14141.1 lasso RiPP family leader peptide-containing protein [Nocardia arthritidis]
MNGETVQAKQTYEAPAIVELGDFNTETAMNTWGNLAEVQYPYVISYPPNS